ncbi:amidohydrolase family protein [Aquimarina mytili]|uniref:Amidohydrolase family protein n=1 Tax=Aquimarina mytili TaxID=874423 RepID=A0A936ZP04_9FLAO|nr:amidohydrolase family protein [Aquimarina mytili]MBL0683114.1 amidohydrolase family protein [Aquimarina mytili]
MKKYTLFLLAFVLHIFNTYSQQFTDQVKTFVAVKDSVIVIKNITLIDGTGGAIKNNQTVIIDTNKIQSIGDSSSIKVPSNAKVIDGTGKTVIPGLVMLHEHMFYPQPFENWFSVGQMTFTFPRLYLAGGVTMMRTAGSIQPQTDLNVKKWISEGKMTGPKMHITGPFIEREGYQIPELGFIDGTSEVAKLVNYWADKGVTSFKVYNHITRKDLKICVEEAHKRGLKVTGHLCSVTYEEASDIGIDNLEHGFMVSSDFMENKEPDMCDPFEARKAITVTPEKDEKVGALIKKLIQNNTVITTTPVVFEPYTNHEMVPGGGQEALAPHVLERIKKTYQRNINKDSTTTVRFHKNMKWVKRFSEEGGLLVAGTDPTGAGRTVAGYANQRTIEILVEAGFSLPEAIKICTLNGATFLNQNKTTGTIEPGKTADLVLINGNLEKDIKNIRKMEIVFKDGVGFDSRKLFESVKGKIGLN